MRVTGSRSRHPSREDLKRSPRSASAKALIEFVLCHPRRHNETEEFARACQVLARVPAKQRAFQSVLHGGASTSRNSNCSTIYRSSGFKPSLIVSGGGIEFMGAFSRKKSTVFRRSR